MMLDLKEEAGSSSIVAMWGGAGGAMGLIKAGATSLKDIVEIPKLANTTLYDTSTRFKNYLQTEAISLSRGACLGGGGGGGGGWVCLTTIKKSAKMLQH